MGSWGDNMHHHGATTTAPARTAALAASASGAPNLGVQRQRVPGRRPLAPRPRHLRPHDYVTAVAGPLLRAEVARARRGGFSPSSRLRASVSAPWVWLIAMEQGRRSEWSRKR